MYFKASQPIVLASQSPRRSELLQLLGFDFQIVPSKKEEPKPEQFDSALSYVINCAEMKAADVAEDYADAMVIGSDTIVVCDGEILLKPEDKEQAMAYLRKLSGRSHEVITAVAVKQGRASCHSTKRRPSRSSSWMKTGSTPIRIRTTLMIKRALTAFKRCQRFLSRR